MAAVAPKKTGIPPRKREEIGSSKLAGAGASILGSPSPTGSNPPRSPGGLGQGPLIGTTPEVNKTPRPSPHRTSTGLSDPAMQAQALVDAPSESSPSAQKKLSQPVETTYDPLAQVGVARERRTVAPPASPSAAAKRVDPASKSGEDFSTVSPVTPGTITTDDSASGEELRRQLEMMEQANSLLQKQLDEKAREAAANAGGKPTPASTATAAEIREREEQLHALLEEANQQAETEKIDLEKKLTETAITAKTVENERNEARQRIQELEAKLAAANAKPVQTAQTAQTAPTTAQTKAESVVVTPAPANSNEKANPHASLYKQEDTRNRYEGAWEESSADKKSVHTVADTLLTWSNNSTNKIQFMPDHMKMSFRGTDMTARLKKNGDKWSQDELEWSDGDIWKRAGLDGSWRDSESGILHSISGSTITTHIGSAKKPTKPMTIINPTSFSILHEGVTCVARLDDKALKLSWSDGDTWERDNS